MFTLVASTVLFIASSNYDNYVTNCCFLDVLCIQRALCPAFGSPHTRAGNKSLHRVKSFKAVNICQKLKLNRAHRFAHAGDAVSSVVTHQH